MNCLAPGIVGLSLVYFELGLAVAIGSPVEVAVPGNLVDGYGIWPTNYLSTPKNKVAPRECQLSYAEHEI